MTNAGYGAATSIVAFSKEGSMYNLSITKLFEFSLFVFTSFRATKDGRQGCCRVDI